MARQGSSRGSGKQRRAEPRCRRPAWACLLHASDPLPIAISFRSTFKHVCKLAPGLGRYGE